MSNKIYPAIKASDWVGQRVALCRRLIPGGKEIPWLGFGLDDPVAFRFLSIQDEVASMKKRIKALQKDLAAEREQVSALKQFDAPRMKKNLDASKKKLAEKTKANDALQKSLNKTKGENAELKRKVEELEAKLESQENLNFRQSVTVRRRRSVPPTRPPST